MFEKMTVHGTALEGQAYTEQQKELLANVAELRQLLQTCWTKEMSTYPHDWVPSCPEIGQCNSTALLVQDLFGGDVVFLSLAIRPQDPFGLGGGLGTHVRNRILGMDIDLTETQYAVTNPGDDILIFEEATEVGPFPTVRDWTKQKPEIWEKYQLLVQRFGEQHPEFVARFRSSQNLPAQ